MRIEAGKRYVRRDGKISGVIEQRKGIIGEYAFEDPVMLKTYRADGMWNGEHQVDSDLISEYIEPPSQEAVEIKVLRDEVAALTAALETLSRAFVIAQETLCDLVPMVLAIKHQLDVNGIVDEWDIDNTKDRLKEQAAK